MGAPPRLPRMHEVRRPSGARSAAVRDVDQRTLGTSRPQAPAGGPGGSPGDQLRLDRGMAARLRAAAPTVTARVA